MNTNYPNGRLANEFQERAHQARSYCLLTIKHNYQKSNYISIPYNTHLYNSYYQTIKSQSLKFVKATVVIIL